MKRIVLLLVLFVMVAAPSLRASYLLIPMDETQKNHLKAYGIAYFALERDVEVTWLLNYRGGSFMMKYADVLEREARLRGVSVDVIADGQSTAILSEIADASVNMDAVRLQKAPKIAVYSPKSKLPWDDAVTLVLTYAEIPYDVVYDEEVMAGVLPTYDWLHLHHEDFTGQYGKFWGNYRNAQWYIEDVRDQEERAHKLGFSKVSQLKLAVCHKIRDFVMGGGFLFAMCSAPDTEKLYAVVLQHSAKFPHELCLTVEAGTRLLVGIKPAVHLGTIILVHMLLKIKPVVLPYDNFLGVGLPETIKQEFVVQPNQRLAEAVMLTKIAFCLRLVFRIAERFPREPWLRLRWKHAIQRLDRNKSVLLLRKKNQQQNHCQDEEHRFGHISALHTHQNLK